MLPDPTFDCLENDPTPFAQRLSVANPGDIIQFTLSEITQNATAGILTDVLLVIRALVPAPPAIWLTRQARRAAMIALSCVMPPAFTCTDCHLDRQPCYRIAPRSFSTDGPNANIRCSNCSLKGSRAKPCEVLVGNLDKEYREQSLFLTERDELDELLGANPIRLDQFPGEEDNGNAGYSKFDDLFAHLSHQQDSSHHANSAPGSEQALRWAYDVAEAMGFGDALDTEEDENEGGSEDERGRGVDLALLQDKAYHAMIRPNITYQLLKSKPHFLQPTPLTKVNLEQIKKVRSKRSGPKGGVGAGKKAQKRKATENTSNDDRETSSNDQSSDNPRPSKRHATSAAPDRVLAFYKSRIATHLAAKFKSDADAKAAEEFLHGTFDSMRMAVMDQPGLADGIQDELLDRIYDRLFARALVYPVPLV